MLEIVSGDLRFAARLEEEAAPQTVAAFRRLLPLRSQIIHARWSGEAAWIPFGELDVGIGPENATRHPAPGDVLAEEVEDFALTTGKGHLVPPGDLLPNECRIRY